MDSVTGDNKTPTTGTNPSNEKISTNKFLEFLKITCQVNDSILYGDHCHHSKSSKAGNKLEIDYDTLASNEMINNLMGNQFKESIQELCNSEGDGKKQSNDKTKNKSSLALQSSKCFPAKINGTNKTKGIHPELAAKLEEVINEGILDSVLPYICPPQPSPTPSTTSNTAKGCKPKMAEINQNPKPMTSAPNTSLDVEKKPEPDEISPSGFSRNPRLSDGANKVKKIKIGGARRKSVGMGHHNDEKKTEDEVVIHVCDEVKNTSKDFKCPQHLLVSKMGYFADVTAGQKLEDMDISVHCDIQIFDWLMKWVKKDSPKNTRPSSKNSCDNTSGPQLEASNVVPILVSASFLQMEPLLIDCLSFCHSKLNDVVRSSGNLSCLNDSIITRLAAMFTNIELELVKDKKERVTPRLWTKLIQSLCEPEPQALRGHYFSLAGIYRCSKCCKYLTQSVSSFVNCTPSNTRLNRWGQSISQHTRDLTWNLNSYISALFQELNYSWRQVYWKLWGHCHFLYCCICETHFPVYQMTWCLFHPEPPQFLGPLTEGHAAGPAGRYPCCGQQAFRFETLPGPNGCQYREHSVLVETDRDRAILALTQIAAEGGCLYEPNPPKPTNQQQQNFEPRWVGMSLMPIKCRQGILPPLHVENNSKMSRRYRQSTVAQPEYFNDSSSDSESTSETDQSGGKFIRRQFSNTSSDGCESENSSSPRNYRSMAARRRAKSSGRYWCGEVSARSNQDNQREFEEKVMKHVATLVKKKIAGCESAAPTQNSTSNNQGGTYVRLEAEWKENRLQKNFLKQRTQRQN